MTNEPPPPKETLTVKVPLSLSGRKTVRDPVGNTITYPSFSDKIRLFSGPDLARIHNPKGALMCAISQGDSYAIENASDLDLLASIVTRNYNFEAPVGSIPNLCKKKESPSK